MRNTNCIASKSDYDCYTMHLPVSVILKKKSLNYIYGQLEKVHPCFNKDTKVKSRVRLNKQGFLSEVLVMNPYKLEEYYRRYPGKKIWINDVQDTFEDFGNKKTLVRLLLLCVVLVLLFGVSYFSLKNEAEKKLSGIKAAEITKNEAEKTAAKALEQRVKPGNILQLICGENGNINQLEINALDGRESFSFCVENVYPEKFLEFADEINISKVTYVNGIPALTVTSKEKVKSKAYDSKLPAESIAKLRQVLTGNKCELLYEAFSDSYIKFRLSDTGNFEALLKEMELCLKECEISLETLKIQTENPFELLFEIKCRNGNSSENIFEGINKALLVKEEPYINVSSSEKVKIFEKKSEKKQQQFPGVKLGEIQRKNGVTVIFYKTPDGKIIKEEK